MGKPSGEGEASHDETGLYAKFAADPTHYGRVRILQFDPKALGFGAPDSADMVIPQRAQLGGSRYRAADVQGVLRRATSE